MAAPQVIRVLFCVAGALAAPQFLPDQQQDFVQSGLGQGGGIQPNYGSSGAQTRILSQKFVQDIVGNYEYSYDQDNGQTVVEVGRSQPGPAPETGTLSKRGSYSYIGDDGNTYRVDYTADEGGFQPQAAHLPVAPAQIPEYAQLRQEHPELFWAENQGQGVILNDQQFVQQPVFDQQLPQQSFSDQQLGLQQSPVSQRLSEPRLVNEIPSSVLPLTGQSSQSLTSDQLILQRSSSVQQIGQQSLNPVSQRLGEVRAVDEIEIPAGQLPLAEAQEADEQNKLYDQSFDLQSFGRAIGDEQLKQQPPSQLNLFGALAPPS